MESKVTAVVFFESERHRIKKKNQRRYKRLETSEELGDPMSKFSIRLLLGQVRHIRSNRVLLLCEHPLHSELDH